MCTTILQVGNSLNVTLLFGIDPRRQKYLLANAVALRNLVRRTFARR